MRVGLLTNLVIFFFSRETWGDFENFDYNMYNSMHKSITGAYDMAFKFDNLSLHSEISENQNKSAQNLVVKLVFLVGQNKNAFLTNNNKKDELQKRVDKEAKINGDILQENFLDSYNNLTLKSIMLLKWATHKCRKQVEYVLKVDDDTFVNVPNLIHVLLGGNIPVYNSTVGFLDQRILPVKLNKKSKKKPQDLLLGHLFCGVKPVSDTTSKWYTPYYLYEADWYPPYLSGTAYLMSIVSVQKLYHQSLRTPYFHLEDVYITGICASKLNLKPKHHPLFFYSMVKDANKSQLFCALRGMVSQHNLSPTDMLMAFNFVVNRSIVCFPPGTKQKVCYTLPSSKKRC